MSIEPAHSDDLERPRSRGLEISFQLHSVTYLVVNAMLIAIWLAARSASTPFWPVWPIITWLPALLIHGWITYGRVHGD